jgi:hypothetical protein
MLQKLGDEVGAEEYSIARGGPMFVRTTRPIRISVDHQLLECRASQEEAKI